MTIRLLLYGTAACHLCEQALALLHEARTAIDIGWSEIDIADDDMLLERYGLLIPVLRLEKNGSELHWPFNAAELHAWLQSGSLQQ